MDKNDGNSSEGKNGQDDQQGRDASKEGQGQNNGGHQGGNQDGGKGSSGGSSSTTEDADNLNKALKAARADTKAEKEKASQLAARLEKLEQANQTEQEKALAQARKEGEDQIRAEWDKERSTTRVTLVESVAQALAAEAGFRSVADVKLLDLSGVPVDGTAVDRDFIRVELKKLAESEPWRLTSADATPRVPRQDPSQGSGRDAQAKPGQRGIDEAQKRFGKPQQAATT